MLLFVPRNGRRLLLLGILLVVSHAVAAHKVASRQQYSAQPAGRERLSINSGWRFQRFTENPDGLNYEKLKQWIMPSANKFINNPSEHAERPGSQPGNISYAEITFNDDSWEKIDLPHDWAIKGPFYTGNNTPVINDMGRLPVQGVGWYRRKFDIFTEDENKAIYLDVDGAMSYASVWLNGVIVGGWPYGYASFRMDLNPYLNLGENQLAIRLDQKVNSSRWYPGAGIYRNVWLTKVNDVHVGQSGTFISSRSVSTEAATLDLVVQIDHTAKSNKSADVQTITDVHVLDTKTDTAGEKLCQFPTANLSIKAGDTGFVNGSVKLPNPKLWGPRPTQEPNMHIAITRLYVDGQLVDTYETPFGIRSLEYTTEGLRVNNERIYLQGVCQHHDLGSLGGAFNTRAAERQLQMLQEMGSNAVRTSHNVPAPELLHLADRMGILVLDEIFDTWNYHKVPNDFQIIFADWSEPDLRSFIRRDRNHPSVWAWSFGNEIPEQGNSTGVAEAQRLKKIAYEEDKTRKTTVGKNDHGDDLTFYGVTDLIGLNYQGEGMGRDNATFQKFRDEFPDRMIFSTESSSVVSSRGTYIFPVANESNAIVGNESSGADTKARQVSSYELYAVSWGSTPDKVFAAQDQHPYVGGEFVWTGWDYIGEPTPFNPTHDDARSSYFGSIDLAGFKKDRFYLYQARWNPDVRMAHILPHWNFPDREGQITPVHVFSSGDEAELFINGESQGRQKRGEYVYRFRWDSVTYEPGEVHVATYKNGEEWANATVRTTGEATKLHMSSYQDRKSIKADGRDLSFITVSVTDDNGDVVPEAEPTINFSIDGPGEIVSTDNGDPTDMTAFSSKDRKAFRGLALVIVRADVGASGPITVRAETDGLMTTEITLDTA